MNDQWQRSVTLLGTASAFIAKLIVEDTITSSSDEDFDDVEMPMQGRIRSDILTKTKFFNELSNIDFRSHFRITKGSTEVR